MSAKVELGFFSFTEVTDPSQHRAYNEWHLLDHLPQQFVLPGIVLGQRWVSTPPCTQARAFSSTELDSVHYFTSYLMSEPVASTLEGLRALAVELHAAGRFFEHRKARLSGPFTVVHERAAARLSVSAEVIPFRANRGVYVISESFPDADALARAANDAFREEKLSLLSEAPGVAGVWSFSTLYGFDRLRWRPGDRHVTLCYLDESPVECASSLGDLVRRLWKGREPPEFAGPFETIVPWEWGWFDS